MITLNSPIPTAEVFRHGSNGPETFEFQNYCAEGITVLFALPAAFSPTCSEKQLPGYVRESANLKAAGADRIACLSVNDTFVMNAWGKQLGAIDSGIDMIADAGAALTTALDAAIDLSAKGLNVRSRRYAMIIVDGTIRHIAEEDNPGILEASSAEKILAALKSL